MAEVLAVLSGICGIVIICFLLCGVVQLGLLVHAHGTNAWDDEREISLGLGLLILMFIVPWFLLGLAAVALGYDI